MHFLKWIVPLACAVAAVSGGANAGERAMVSATADTPPISAYVARPRGAAAVPGVLILHGCEGYTPRIAALADWVAANGYAAVAIDVLAPTHMRTACTDPIGWRTTGAYARVTLDWMRTQPYIDGRRLMLLGYSMGATGALEVADPFQTMPVPSGLQGAVAYYPGCRNRTAAHIAVPILILAGDADDWTPVAPCQTLAAAAAVAEKPLTIATYPGATHAFNFDAPERSAFGHRMRYDAAAAADADAKTLAFFKRYLSGP